ncbi:ERF family protein [Paraburkholderia sediminicola]|uniref:ERF family protein n=1 Tax=Paraburkholderia sediminicola TaxID=458836 RepID=UPI0038B921E1
MNAPLEMTAEQARPAFDLNLIPGKDGDMGPIFEALAIAQGKFLPIEKNKTADIRAKEPGKASYKFDYADMAEIRAKTTPALSENKLGIVSVPTARAKGDGGHVLRTMIVHSSGARIESVLVIPQQQEVKNFGGYITYLRRYVVSAMLNVAADDDIDDADDGDTGGENGTLRPGPARTAPFNPAENPLLTSAQSVAELNKVWMGFSADNRAKFETHYQKCMDAFDGTPSATPAPTPSPATAVPVGPRGGKQAAATTVRNGDDL